MNRLCLVIIQWTVNGERQPETDNVMSIMGMIDWNFSKA